MINLNCQYPELIYLLITFLGCFLTFIITASVCLSKNRDNKALYNKLELRVFKIEHPQKYKIGTTFINKKFSRELLIVEYKVFGSGAYYKGGYCLFSIESNYNNIWLSERELNDLTELKGYKIKTTKTK